MNKTVVQAVQWFENGDHPEDGTETFQEGEFKGELSEGKVVRYYRSPKLDGANVCNKCGWIMHLHGWIDSGGDGQIVCPRDFVIPDSTGKIFVCDPTTAKATFPDFAFEAVSFEKAYVKMGRMFKRHYAYMAGQGL